MLNAPFTKEITENYNKAHGAPIYTQKSAEKIEL